MLLQKFCCLNGILVIQSRFYVRLRGALLKSEIPAFQNDFGLIKVTLDKRKLLLLYQGNC